MFEKLIRMDDVQSVHLDLFDHQVSGHHLMLRYDDTTLCKSLTPREHRFYENLPDDLREFVPEYRGVIEVDFEEDSEGYITMIGHPQELCETLVTDTRQLHELGDSPVSSGSDIVASSQNKTSIIRLLQNGSIEVNSKKDHVSWNKKTGVNPWSLKCHKENLTKMSRISTDTNKCIIVCNNTYTTQQLLRTINECDKRHGKNTEFILLENVVAQFEHPCILDLKMGTRQHGDDASDVKRECQIKKCAATTSKCLGIRLGGMQVYQPNTGNYINHDKYYGRSLNSENFHQALYQFLHNGMELRTSLIDLIIQRLEKLCHIVKQQDTFRFYSSSLLILYDGAHHKTDTNTEASDTSIPFQPDPQTAKGATETHTDNADVAEKVDVRMIDFSHATYDGFNDSLVHTGPDSGYLFGLENLIRMFHTLKTDYS